MVNHMTLKKFIHFPLTKMIIGIVVVGGSVGLTEWMRTLLAEKIPVSEEIKNLVIGVIEAFLALLSYILLFKFYEKKKIKELSLSAFPKNALIGFFTGWLLQSLVILVIYLNGGYSLIHVNPVSFLLPAFTFALTAGFVAEILIRGIIFRLTEEKTGTVIALIISALLFAVLHCELAARRAA